MNFYPIPDPRNGAVTAQMIADLQQIGVMPRSIGAFSDVRQWQDLVGTQPVLDGHGAKYWRENAVNWDLRTSYDYLMLARNADGSYATTVLISEPNASVYSEGAINFYLEYASHFPRLPGFVVTTLSRFDAARLNFGHGTPMDYPVGTYLENDPTVTGDRRPTFPGTLALRFNPQTGQVEAFFWEEYIRTYPLNRTPAPSATPPRLSDGELVNAVTVVVGGSLDTPQKAAIIRQLSA